MAPEPVIPAAVVLLMNGSAHGWCVANGLRARLGALTVIQETAEGKLEILKRRARLSAPT